LVEETYAVAHWTEMAKGGHFAAVEQPGVAGGYAGVFWLKNVRQVRWPRAAERSGVGRGYKNSLLKTMIDLI
jgi:hypothetical protein